MRRKELIDKSKFKEAAKLLKLAGWCILLAPVINGLLTYLLVENKILNTGSAIMAFTYFLWFLTAVFMTTCLVGAGNSLIESCNDWPFESKIEDDKSNKN